jgi:hypothetical protein
MGRSVQAAWRSTDGDRYRPSEFLLMLINMVPG